MRMGQGRELSKNMLSGGEAFQPDHLGALEHNWCHRPGPTLRPICTRLPLAAGCRLQAAGRGEGHRTSWAKQLLLD